MIAYTFDGESYCPDCIEDDENNLEIGVVFADSQDEIIGWTCGTCGDCYTPDGWTPSDSAVKDYRWSCCPSCNSQQPYNNNSQIRLQALQGKLQCDNCLKPTHF